MSDTVQIPDKFKSLFYAIKREIIPQKFIVLYGGRGSSKSTVGGIIANWLSFQPKYRILYTRFTAASIAGSTQLDFEDAAELMGCSSVYRKSGYQYHNKQSGGMVYLKGLKSGQKTTDAGNKSLKDFNVWICDEATDIPDVETFQTMELSIRDLKKPNIVILILNPSNKRHWIYEHFWLQNTISNDIDNINPSTEIEKIGWYTDLSIKININYTDVERFLNPSFIKIAKSIKEKNPEIYDNVFLGKWRDREEGTVLDYILDFFPENSGLSECYGMDFGHSDHNAVMRIAVDFKNKKIYWKQEIYINGVSTDELSKRMFARLDKKKKIVCDSAQRQSRFDLKLKGHNIQAVKKPEVQFSIDRLRDFTLIIDPRSAMTIKQLDTYISKDGVIIQKNNHTIDAGRYGTWFLIS